MNSQDIHTVAVTLWQHWNQFTRFDELPPLCRPANRAEAYAVQAEFASLSGEEIAGWKIAATSLAGQAHIGVDGPMAGRLLASRLLKDGAVISLQHNLMRVAEAEFAFRFGQALPEKSDAYSVADVLAAVGTLHPAIEIPDSRYHDFARAGAPQLIADNACACWFIPGQATTADWRSRDLSQHRVEAFLNGALVATGSGERVLGDPRIALAWIANELRTYGNALRPGDIVTTGTCIAPLAIVPGDHLRVDFGAFGTLEAAFA